MPPLSSQSSVAAYLDEWLALQRSRLQPSTWESYRIHVECYLVPALGETLLAELTTAQLTTFYARLQQAGGRLGQPLSLRSVRYCHGVLHKALADAVRLDLLARNVAANAMLPRIEVPGKERDELRTWTADQLRDFLEHTIRSPLHPLWLVAATTGLRRGELLGLRWDDVHLDAGRLDVRRALSVVKKQAQLKQPKTSRCRSLQLDAVTVDALRHHRQRAPASDWNLVFTEPDGRHLDPMQVTHAFRVAVRGAPVPRLTLHGLRHTHASLLLQAGVPVKVVSERLGHATISLTLDIYAHVLPTMDADAADRFSAVVFGQERE